MSPFVSIIIPCRNEEKFIEKCLDSIIAQDYPKNKLEVLVIDGMSSDRSREIVENYAKGHSFIRLLENPKRIVPTALNIGIREAKGEIIVWMSAHSTFAPDYIRQCISALQTTGAANVGGTLQALGTGYISNAIAVAATSPFGIGDARYRYSNREEWVDTVFPGTWRKETLQKLGGFNEEWVVNQDYELNYRLRQAGGKILLSPKVKCQYYVRGSLKTLARQYFRYGFWKVKTLVAHPDSLRWRQLVPPVFVLGLLVSLALLLVSRLGGLIIPGAYILANLVTSFLIAWRRGLKYLPIIPFIFATIHLSWGLGFWVGIIRFGIPRLHLKSIIQAFRSPGKR